MNRRAVCYEKENAMKPGFKQRRRRCGWQGGVCLLLLVALFKTASANKPPITDIVFAPDGESIVAASQLGVQQFRWPDLSLENTLDVSTPNLHCLAFSPSGQYLAVGGGRPSEEGVVEVYSWPQREFVARFDDHDDSIRSLVWRDDTTLLTASLDRDIKQWQLGTTAIANRFSGHSRGVNSLCLLSDGKTLVSAGADQSLRVWDLESTKLQRSLNQHTKSVRALALRPGKDGLPLVASAAGDRLVRLW
ncbi:MAG: hypothetical protein AAFP90_22185, partial [Planctomycetota bacterium]